MNATCWSLFLCVPLLALAACETAPTVIHPDVSGTGSITADTVPKYDTIAVFKFTDAPGAERSGASSADVLSTIFAGMGFNVIDRSRLDQTQDEQAAHARLKIGNPLDIGKSLGAKAIVVGEVSLWETHQKRAAASNVPANASGGTYRMKAMKWTESNVALTFRILDAETGTVVFTGAGHFPQPLAVPPLLIARAILGEIMQKFALQIKPPPERSGVGARLDLASNSNEWLFVVKALQSNGPAALAGVRVGDLIETCNGATLRSRSKITTLFLWLTRCSPAPGERMDLGVLRGNQSLRLSMLAAGIAPGGQVSPPEPKQERL